MTKQADEGKGPIFPGQVEVTIEVNGNVTPNEWWAQQAWDTYDVIRGSNPIVEVSIKAIVADGGNITEEHLERFVDAMQAIAQADTGQPTEPEEGELAPGEMDMATAATYYDEACKQVYDIINKCKQAARVVEEHPIVRVHRLAYNLDALAKDLESVMTDYMTH